MDNCPTFKNVYSISVVLLIVLFSGHLLARDTSGKIDSLLEVLKTAKTDTDRVNIYIALSANTGKADSVNKKGYAIQALQLAERIKWDRGIIASSNRLTDVYQSCYDYTGAIAYSTSMASVAKETGDRYNEEIALYKIGCNYQQLSQYVKALEYYREALALKAEPNIELSILGNMGIIYSDLGDYPRALASYDSSRAALEAIMRTAKDVSAQDTMQEALLIITIGDIYRNIGEYSHALSNYQKALKLSGLVSSKYIEVLALRGIATTYYYQHRIDSAIACDSSALIACMRIDDAQSRTQEETGIFHQLGDAYLLKGDMDKAMGYAQRSLQLAEANNYTDLQPESQVTLGKIYTRLKDYNKAISHLRKAVEIATQNGALQLEEDAFDALSVAYEQAKQPGLALDAYRHSRAIQDSLYSMSRTNELIRTDIKGDYDRKQITDSLAQAGSYNLRMQKQRAYTISGFAGLAVVLVLSFFIYRSYSKEKKALVLVSSANEKLSDEKQLSESLLLNILPEDVAKELKVNGDVQPRLFDNVTVLFTDFVNFTIAGDRLTPQELVAELHNCFKAFDSIIGKYSIEKIKTVGDAYIAVSGLPQPNANHAADIVRAALEIRDFMAERKKQFPENTFEIRLGINSGPVVAGIVGAKKFAYDIWGDTVNVAARMEQYSEAGKVNISEKTYAMVKGMFTCRDRGRLNVKNKGEMGMYFVDAPIHSPNS